MRIDVIFLFTILGFMSSFSNQKDEIGRFIGSIYRNYQIIPDYNCYGPGADTIFAPQLLRLIREDSATTPEGDVGFLDYIVFCNCQDVEGLTLDKVTVSEKSGQFYANVKLSFSRSEDNIALQIHVTKIESRWYVADIGAHGVPSLTKALKSHIAKYSPGQKSQ